MTGELVCETHIMVPLARPKAYALFVDNVPLWWTSAFEAPNGDDETETLLDGAIEPCAGGVCYEIGLDGKRRVWGTVLSLEPPLYIRIAWQVSPDRKPVPDPAAASRVMIAFRDAGEFTRIEVVQSEFLRHGVQGESYGADLAETGWNARLAQIKAAASLLR